MVIQNSLLITIQSTILIVFATIVCSTPPNKITLDQNLTTAIAFLVVCLCLSHI